MFLPALQCITTVCILPSLLNGEGVDNVFIAIQLLSRVEVQDAGFMSGLVCASGQKVLAGSQGHAGPTAHVPTVKVFRLNTKLFAFMFMFCDSKRSFIQNGGRISKPLEKCTCPPFVCVCFVLFFQVEV